MNMVKQNNRGQNVVQAPFVILLQIIFTLFPVYKLIEH